MDLSKARHAFVTGGASGLGLGIADALAARGLRVTLADIDAETLRSVVAERGPGFRAQVLDTRDRDGWQRAKAAAEAAFGPVDILVNNAGISPNGRELADMAAESFDRIVAINLTGVYNGVWAFAADMRARGRGHIVNTASQAGLSVNAPRIGPYTVAKYGVVALSETLRMELAPHGVGVSALCPGYVETNLGANTVKVGGDIGFGDASQIPVSDVTAAHVGACVVRGIERDDLYIFTHSGTWAQVEKRMAAIKAAWDQSGMA
jgi:NAD(P)-dependent dehydrogenase (short-subunit alcohol dehydrogenase family)